jgi:hypothetical protein
MLVIDRLPATGAEMPLDHWLNLHDIPCIRYLGSTTRPEWAGQPGKADMIGYQVWTYAAISLRGRRCM